MKRICVGPSYAGPAFDGAARSRLLDDSVRGREGANAAKL